MMSPGYPDYDVLIAGGGMVGASLAYALSGAGLRIGVVEAVPLASSAQPSYDDRAIALAFGTRRIFEVLGLWPALQPQAGPIRRIHISDRGHFGFARLEASHLGVDALGYVMDTRHLGQVLGQALTASETISLLCPCQVTALSQEADTLRVTVSHEGANEELSARLLVAADGVHSTVRELAGIGSRRWDYGQTAVIANVTPERAHGGTAFERFTDSGPLALLPMADERCSVVWTTRPEQVDALLALSDEAFVNALSERFGARLGHFQRTGRRRSYPLSLVQAERSTAPRIALVGNAAHTLHPVAGQGLNLGMRDVAVLAEIVADTVRAGDDPGSAEVTAAYAARRRRDHGQVIAFTDLLARGFANPLPPVRWLRDVSLLAVDLLPPVKRALARRTMGVAAPSPRLVRGLPL